MAFYSKDGRYYLSIPEFTRDFEVESDKLGFNVKRKHNSGTIQYIVYVTQIDEDGAWPYSVSKETYDNIRTSYLEYIKHKREVAEQKRIKYEKHLEEEEYRRKHPVFEIKGNATVTPPWKKT